MPLVVRCPIYFIITLPGNKHFHISYVSNETGADFQSINRWLSKKSVIRQGFPKFWTKELSYAGLVLLRKIFVNHWLEEKAASDLGKPKGHGGGRGSLELGLKIWTGEAEGKREGREGWVLEAIKGLHPALRTGSRLAPHHEGGRRRHSQDRLSPQHPAKR